MWKYLIVFLFLVQCSAFSQVRYGTIVIVDLAKDQFVIAADSRTNLNGDPQHPDDSQCKVTTLGNQFVFATMGNAYAPVVSTDRVGQWDNITEAIAANKTTDQRPPGFRILELTETWTAAVMAHWKRFNDIRPDRVDSIARQSNDIITVGLFATSFNGIITPLVSQIVLDRSSSPAAIVRQLGSLGNCWECNGDKICAAGSHIDIAANFCSIGKSRRIRTRTKLSVPTSHTKLAVKIVELTIDAYQHSPGDVGGEVDAVTLKRNGSIKWNAQKRNCRERR